jgi:WD40 repeat protein
MNSIFFFFFPLEQLSGPCNSVVWDTKKKYLIVGVKEVIQIFKVNKNTFESSNMLEEVATITLPSPSDLVRCINTFNGRLLCGSFERALCLFETSGRPILKIQKAHKAAISVIAYDQDNSRFLSGGFDKKVKIWNQDGTIVSELAGFGDIITGICYNPMTKMLWVAANSPQPLVYDAITGSNVNGIYFFVFFPLLFSQSFLLMANKDDRLRAAFATSWSWEPCPAALFPLCSRNHWHHVQPFNHCMATQSVHRHDHIESLFGSRRSASLS